MSDEITYLVFGFKATERDDNSALAASQQKVTGNGDIIYRTTNLAEAESIRLAGGFIKDETWHVVTSVAPADAVGQPSTTDVKIEEVPLARVEQQRKSDLGPFDVGYAKPKRVL